MTVTASIDQEKFRSILTRNITLPLGIGTLSAALFVGLIFFLLSSLSWVEHTERVIGNANEISKLSIDMETGMRGYLITGEDSFLQPYDIAKSRIGSEIAALSTLVGDNPQQVDRLRRIAALQAQWNEFGQNAIELRRQQGNYQDVIRAGRGKAITDEMRREFQSFVAMERRLLQDRNDDAILGNDDPVVQYPRAVEQTPCAPGLPGGGHHSVSVTLRSPGAGWLTIAAPWLRP